MSNEQTPLLLTFLYIFTYEYIYFVDVCLIVINCDKLNSYCDKKLLFKNVKEEYLRECVKQKSIALEFSILAKMLIIYSFIFFFMKKVYKYMKRVTKI